MSKIIVGVEFLAGTDLKFAIREAKDKALKWDVAFVCFSFNGTDFYISRSADERKCLEKYASRGSVVS